MIETSLYLVKEFMIFSQLLLAYANSVNISGISVHGNVPANYNVMAVGLSNW